MSKELEEAIKSLKSFSYTLYGTFSPKEGQAVLNYIDNSIHKEVVEKKIEKLNNEEKEIYKKDIGNNELYRLKIIDENRNVLQELLEDE